MQPSWWALCFERCYLQISCPVNNPNYKQSLSLSGDEGRVSKECRSKMCCSAEAGSGAVLQRTTLCLLWPYQHSPLQLSFQQSG